MSQILPWKNRLCWSKPQSPTGAERLKAAQEEIRELRKEIERMSRSDLNKQIHRLERLLESARTKADFWRRAASANRKTIKPSN